jgi:hypothetical protein
MAVMSLLTDASRENEAARNVFKERGRLAHTQCEFFSQAKEIAHQSSVFSVCSCEILS